MPYDAIALLAAVPAMRTRFFSPQKVGAKNLLIGMSQEQPGVVE